MKNGIFRGSEPWSICISKLHSGPLGKELTGNSANKGRWRQDCWMFSNRSGSEDWTWNNTVIVKGEKGGLRKYSNRGRSGRMMTLRLRCHIPDVVGGPQRAHRTCERPEGIQCLGTHQRSTGPAHCSLSYYTGSWARYKEHTHTHLQILSKLGSRNTHTTHTHSQIASERPLPHGILDPLTLFYFSKAPTASTIQLTFKKMLIINLLSPPLNVWFRRTGICIDFAHWSSLDN